MRKLKSTERPVLPTPFDDDVDDGPPVVKSVVDDAPDVPDTRDYTLKRISAWICKDPDCPGRKPASYMPDDGKPIRCECGRDMVIHGWSKKTRF
jgi:hypothetical protein